MYEQIAEKALSNLDNVFFDLEGSGQHPDYQISFGGSKASSSFIFSCDNFSAEVNRNQNDLNHDIHSLGKMLLNFFS